MGYLDADQLRANYLEKMGSVLGAYYYELYKEVVWAHARWQQYRKLFADKDNVKLLNGVAGFLFKLIQDSLWDDTLLHISRLTDPPKLSRNENLSIRGLPERISDPLLEREVAGLVERAVAAADFARKHRNKRLAHRDLQHSTFPNAKSLTGVSRACVEDMLKTIREVMNRIEQEYCNGMVEYEMFISSGNADSLIRVLKSKT